MNEAPEVLLQELSAAGYALAAAAETVVHPHAEPLVAMMHGAAEVIAGAVRRYPAARRPDIPGDAREQMRLLVEAARAIIGAATGLEDCERVGSVCAELRVLRERAPVLLRRALAGIEPQGTRSVHLMMWRRDLHQRLGWALDRCGYAGLALERLCATPAARSV